MSFLRHQGDRPAHGCVLVFAVCMSDIQLFSAWWWCICSICPLLCFPPSLFPPFFNQNDWIIFLFTFFFWFLCLCSRLIPFLFFSIFCPFCSVLFSLRGCADVITHLVAGAHPQHGRIQIKRNKLSNTYSYPSYFLLWEKI